MKSLKKLKKRITGKTISKAQADQLKGGDDKRKGPSGTGGITPGSDGCSVDLPLLP